MAENKLPTYYVEFTDDAEKIQFISLVSEPAIEINWVAFSKQLQVQFKQISDQQKLAGPLMIPNVPIYRSDSELGEYNLMFTKEVIQKMADKFNMESLNHNINLEHIPNSKIKGAYVTENWIVEAPDKSKKFGFDLPDGTWFGVVKIDNEQFWNSFVKDKKILGFSIEGLLGLTHKKPTTMKKTIKLAGTPVITETPLQDGTSLFLGIVDADNGFITLGIDAYSDADGKTVAPDAEYVSKDGTAITVLKGKVQGIETATEDTADDASTKPEKEVGTTLDAKAPAEVKQSKVSKFTDMKTTDGNLLSAGSFEIGQDVMITNADGSQTPAPDGSYIMEDGSKITVAKGLIADVAAQENMADAATAPAATDATPTANPELDAMASALKDVTGQVAILSDRLSALEDALVGANTTNEELMSKVEKLSKLPGAKSVITEAKLAKPATATSPKTKQTFAEQVEILRKLKLAQK